MHIRLLVQGAKKEVVWGDDESKKEAQLAVP